MALSAPGAPTAPHCLLQGSGSLLATRNADLLPSIWRRFPPSWPGASAGGAAAAPCEPGASGDEEQAKAAPSTVVAAREGGGLADELLGLGLRFLTPREVANLHSFPASFSFPADVTLRTRWALLGNSLSVAVVAELLRYLLA